MLHHRTSNPARRAEHIAKAASERVFEETKWTAENPFDLECRTFLQVYGEALEYFSWQPETLKEKPCETSS